MALVISSLDWICNNKFYKIISIIYPIKIHTCLVKITNVNFQDLIHFVFSLKVDCF